MSNVVRNLAENMEKFVSEVGELGEKYAVDFLVVTNGPCKVNTNSEGLVRQSWEIIKNLKK